MRICPDHWSLMREAVESRGMSGLIAKDGQTAMEDAIADLNEEPDPKHKRFDPLMSMHFHWTNNALRCGGLYLMYLKPDGSEYCPVCEFVAHQPDYDPAAEISAVADQMLAWCRTEGLLPPLA